MRQSSEKLQRGLKNLQRVFNIVSQEACMRAIFCPFSGYYCTFLLRAIHVRYKEISLLPAIPPCVTFCVTVFQDWCDTLRYKCDTSAHAPGFLEQWKLGLRADLVQWNPRKFTSLTSDKPHKNQSQKIILARKIGEIRVENRVIIQPFEQNGKNARAEKRETSAWL